MPLPTKLPQPGSLSATTACAYLPTSAVCEGHRLHAYFASPIAQVKLLTFEVICSVVAGFDFDQQELQQLSDQLGWVRSGLLQAA